MENCRKTLPPKGKLLIVESIIPRGNTFSISKLLDIEMLLMGGGKERTREEFKGLLENAGFEMSRIFPTQADISIMECMC